MTGAFKSDTTMPIGSDANFRATLIRSSMVFPRAHYEIAVLLRAEAAVTTLDRRDLLGFLQLYYL